MLPGAPKGRVCAQGKAGGGFPVFVEINIIRLSPTTHLLLTRELEEPQRPGDGGGGENGKKRLQVLKGSVLVLRCPADSVCTVQQSERNPRYISPSGLGAAGGGHR